MTVFTNSLVLEVFSGLTIGLFGLYLYFKLVFYDYWRKRGVAFVEPSVPTGSIIEYIKGKEHIADCFAKAYDKLKKNRYFGIYTFHKPSLVIADPDLIKEVLTKKFEHFHDRGVSCNEEVDPITGHLFFLPGQKWRNLRVKLTPTFTSAKMKQMFGAVKDKGDVLAQILEDKAQNREVVDIKDITTRFSTDVICSTAFGVDCDSLHDPDNEFYYWGKKVFDYGPIKNALVFFAPEVMNFFRIPLVQSGLSKFFFRVFKETVDYRESNDVKRGDLMEILMQLMNAGHIEEDEMNNTNIPGDGKISLTEATAQAFVFYIAGFETSSTTASYCLYELSIHPEIQEKVRNEIEIVIKKHGDITYESLNDMTYLHKCVSETLRKYPPLSTLHRVCTKDIDLPTTNLHVNKGIDIVIPVLGIHRDPEIYPDPLKFDPERFTEENIVARHPYSYLPFGMGPRICIGMRFGYVQTKIALISALRKYKFTLGPETLVPLEVDPVSNFIYSSKEINLRIEPLV